MIRYVCNNPVCLNSFLSDLYEPSKKCHCGNILLHFGNIPEKEIPKKLTSQQIIDLYPILWKKSLEIGITEEEGIILGKCVKLTTWEFRKKQLKKKGIHISDNDIFKFTKTKDGLLKRVKDKDKIYRKRKNKNVR